MSETLYDQLRKEDPGIATAFSAAMKGKTKDAKLDTAGADRVFSKAMDNKIITSGEAAALVLIIESGILSPEAWTHLKNKLKGTDAEDAAIRGAKRLKTDAELKLFNKALALISVKKITFWSPGTGHWYRPLHYQTVAELVKRGDIKVFEIATGTLSSHAHWGHGSYDPVENKFYFFKDYGDERSLIIHEATHAIQDMRNFSHALKYLEADAFIAEAVARIDLDLRHLPWAAPARVAAYDKVVQPDGPTVVEMVMDNKAGLSNDTWKKGYDMVVASVEKTRPYADHKDFQWNMKEASGPDEFVNWRRVMESVRGPHKTP